MTNACHTYSTSTHFVHLSLEVEAVLLDKVGQALGGVDGHLVTPVAIVDGEQRRVGVKVQDGVVCVLIVVKAFVSLKTDLT